MNSRESQPDLDWQAFQYVTDALADADREQFEARLLDCQPAREAVARAVEFTLAAEFVFRSETYGAGDRESALDESPAAARRRAPHSASRRQAWILRARRIGWGAVAASLVFLVGWQAALWFLGRDAGEARSGADLAEIMPENNQQSFPSSFAGGRGGDLALAWTQTRKLFSLADGEDSDLVALATLAEGEDSPAFDDPALPPEEVEAPSWMLAAVAGLQAASSPAAPVSEEAISDPLDDRNEG